MLKYVVRGIFLFKIALAATKEAELPLCPTNVLYFPQNLPMHCRMPTSADFAKMPGALPTVPQFEQSPPSDKNRPPSIPMAIPPGFPGPMPMPGSIPMSGPMTIPGPMPMPGSMPLPGPMAIPGPMGPNGPIPFPGMPLSPGPAQKLPVIVMPFYSPDTSFKKGQRPNYAQHAFRPRKRRIRHKRRRPLMFSPPDTSSSTDTEASLESSGSSSSEYQGWWRGKRNHRRFNGPLRMKKRKSDQRRPVQRKQVLTPVLQYVTKDGYVIFEKKITKNEAKDWLDVKKDDKETSTRISPEARDMESIEETDDRSAGKEMATEDKVEVVTKKHPHRLNRIKVQREKSGKNRFSERVH